MNRINHERWGIQKSYSHVSQSGTEVLVDVCFQYRVKVLEFDVANKCDYEHLNTNKRRKQNKSTLKQFPKIHSTLMCNSVAVNANANRTSCCCCFVLRAGFGRKELGHINCCLTT